MRNTQHEIERNGKQIFIRLRTLDSGRDVPQVVHRRLFFIYADLMNEITSNKCSCVRYIALHYVHVRRPGQNDYNGYQEDGCRQCHQTPSGRQNLQ